MAKIKLRLRSLDDLPEDVREALSQYYEKQEDGTFVLQGDDDPEGGLGIGNLAQLRQNLASANKDRDRAQSKLTKFAKSEEGDLYTPEEVAEMATQLEEHKTLVDTLKSKSKDGEAALQEQIGHAKRPLEAKIRELTDTTKKLIDAGSQNARKAAIAKALGMIKPLPEWQGMIESELARHIGVREQDGEFVHFVQDPERPGEPRFSSRSGNDGPMGIDELIGGDFRKTFSRCLQGDNKAGLPMGPSDSDAPKTPAEPGKNGQDVYLTHTQAADSQAYIAAKERAAKQGGEVVVEPPPQYTPQSGGGEE